jgi:hypothetical protein
MMPGRAKRKYSLKIVSPVHCRSHIYYAVYNQGLCRERLHHLIYSMARVSEDISENQKQCVKRGRVVP